MMDLELLLSLIFIAIPHMCGAIIVYMREQTYVFVSMCEEGLLNLFFNDLYVFFNFFTVYFFFIHLTLLLLQEGWAGDRLSLCLFHELQYVSAAL